MVIDMKSPAVQGVCQYEYWDKSAHRMIHCGQLGVLVKLPSNSPKRQACLCKEHLPYVVDCYDRSEIEVYKMKKKEVERKVKQYRFQLENS